MALLKKHSVILALLAATSLVSTQALAHAHLSTSVPAPHSVLSQAPRSITLTFTEQPEPAFSGIDLRHADGSPVQTGKLSTAPSTNTTLILPLTTPLAKGEYQVNWHVLSVDGHKTKGSYSFTLR